MDSAPVAETEPQRLAALRSTGAARHRRPNPAFDELVALTARLLGAPIAAFNLVDADRQWTKAGAGMANGDEAPRADSFCAHAIAGDGPFVVPDTAADPRFADNAMGLGFYAGTPVTAGGQRIGTLCVAGERRRRRRADDLETLRVLAAAVTRPRRALPPRARARRGGRRPAPARGGDEPARAGIGRRRARARPVRHRLRPGRRGRGDPVDGDARRHAARDRRRRLRRRRRRAAARARRGVAPGVRQRRARSTARGDELLGVAGWGAALFQPLLLGGRPVGVLTVFWKRSRRSARARAAADRAALERGGGGDRAHDHAVGAREADPRRRADRHRQPARLRRAAHARAQALRARGQPRRARDVRPRPLQGVQRHHGHPRATGC